MGSLKIYKVQTALKDMEKHYVKYLVIVLVFLFLTLLSYVAATKYNSAFSFSPSEGGAGGWASIGNTFMNLYVNTAPTLSGVFIVAAVALMILIVMDSRG
jgi:hypothetical protein